MRVTGVAADGSTAFSRVLEQGVEPSVLSYDQGFLAVRPLEARRGSDGELELRLLVRPLNGEPRPTPPGRASDPGLEVPAGVVVDVRQRVAAYAVVTSSLGLLATEFSDRTSVAGRWGMPGGGIDANEQPVDAVLREVAEETHQRVTVGELVEVQTSHWVGRSPRDTIEDYHAVRLIYSGTCPEPSEPVVLDVGGTTESARWVPLPSWPELGWTEGWRQVLTRRLGPPGA
jgi:8-oxo-dGTP pyrophosphatase MutT (NUDIX family)